AGRPPARPACAPAAAGPGAGLLRRRAARRRPRDAPAFFLLNEGPCHPGHLTYLAARAHLSKTGRSGLAFMITGTFRRRVQGVVATLLAVERFHGQDTGADGGGPGVARWAGRPGQ